ncbi:hypothetical protein lerEdw1_000135 [Lerista edwardsae]|nr:hypothetical protein lerEdw1_000135 [Lerista edwardsae]
MELGNQICCELEECQTPCLELDPLEYGSDQLLTYQQENAVAHGDEIFLLMKDVVSRRHPAMAPNSRTSSTEAVAGSAPLSQGSSGIMELYGSDIEPQPNAVNFIENPQDHNESVQAQADVNIDLVSPDSGLATIRSSRSSKESSVFLSDDSPVGEGAASHHSFLSGFDSYSPIPEGAIAEEENPQSRNGSKNFDLFSFDLAPMASVQTESSHSVNSSPADDFFHDSGSSEGQPPHDSKVRDETNLAECDSANCSSDLLMVTSEEDSLVKFDKCNFRQENPREFSERKSSLIDLENDSPSCPEVLKNVGRRTPPTRVNSLAESSPLDSGPSLFYPQDITKKINEMDRVNSSESRVRYGSWWDGFELNSKNADAWSSADHESVFQSPNSWKDYKANLLLRQQPDRRSSDSICMQKQSKHADFSRAGIWENQFSAVHDKHALGCQQKENEPQMEDFGSNMWQANQVVPAISGSWDTTTKNGGHTNMNSSNVWEKFDHDGSGHSESAWNVPQMDFDQMSLKNLDTWAMSNCSPSSSPELSADNECKHLNNQVDLGSENKGQDSTIQEHRAYENTTSDIGNLQNNVKLAMEHKNAAHKPKEFDNTGCWDVYDTDIRKEVLENLVPWEDPFLSYRDSDFIAAHEDVIVSPPDTNYSTSDSYVSPTGVGDERESDGKLPDREPVFDQMINLSVCESKTYDIADKKSLPPSGITPSISSDGNSGLWKVPLNNEKQMGTVNSEVTMVTETNAVQLDSEPKDATYFSEDYFVEESSLSSSEDGGIMLASKQENSHSLQHNTIPGVEEKAGICSKSILEDTWCPHLETSELGSVISVRDDINGSEESEKGSAFPAEQRNREDEELQQDQWARWENNDISPASLQEIQEGERSDERNRHVILNNTPNNIRNEITQNDSISLPLRLPLSSTNSSEESKTTPDYPSSPERSSESPKEVAAEINLPFPNQIHSLHEEMSLDSNAECFPISPSEHNIHLVQFDIDGCPKDGFNVASPLVSEHIDKDLSPEDKKITELESLSQCSPGEAHNQGKQAPIIRENQDVWNELKQESPKREASHSLLHKMSEPIGEYEKHLFDKSMSNLDVCNFEPENIENISETNSRLETPLEDKQSEILQSPYAEYVESLDATDVPATNNSLLDEMDSCETTEPSENLDSENKLSNNKCIDIISHHELSQILDAWNISVNEYAQSIDISPEISDSLERSDTVSSFPEDIPPKIVCREDKEDNTCSGSIHDCTHSSATSPDISDSSTNVNFWDNLQEANNQKVNEDEDVITNNGQVEVSGIKSQEDSETSTDHKVPKNLDLWNTHVEDDTVSSLSSPGIDEVSEYLNGHQVEIQSDLQPDELENKRNSFKKEDDLQFSETNIAIDSGSSDVQSNLEENRHVNALNETSEELSASWDTYVNEVSEHLTHRETIQGNVHVSTANEQPQTTYTWNSCVVNNHIAQITVISDEENNASDNSDAWNALLQGHSESTLGKDQKYVTEALGFPDDSSEWWNSEVQGENSMEIQQFDSDDDLKTNDTEVTAHEAVPMKINKKLKEPNLTDSTCDENELIEHNSEGEYNHEELSLAIQKDELDNDNANVEECGSLSPLHKDDKDMEEDPFAPVDREQMTLKQADPEDWRSSLLNALAQVDPALGVLRDNMTVTSSNPNEVKFDQKLLDTSEKSPGVPPLPLKTGRKSTPSCDESPQQKAFVPDILQNNTPGDCQAFTVDPDLWTDVEQPFILRTNRENPDILSHCDQDSSSQASSSPDVCHEYESKQTCAQSSVLAEPEEATQMSPSLSRICKDTDFDFNQQLAIDRGELCLGGEGSCLPDNYETGFDEFYQLTSPRTAEPSKIGRKNSIVQEPEIANKTIELVELPSSYTGSLEVVSINLEDSAFENKSTEEQEDTASTDIIKTVDRYVTLVSPTDDSICSNFSDNDHVLTFDHTTEVVDQVETPHINEVKRDHCINKISVTNNPSTILSEIDHMPMIDSESEEVEMDSILTKKNSLQASLEEEGEDFLYGAGSQYATDIVQESENLPENHSPWFIGSPNIQSPFVCTSPFDASFDTEFILQKGDMNLSEFHTTDIKCEVAGRSPGDQDWGSLLVESEVAPESSCILKGFDSETEACNIDSPGVGNDMNCSMSTASDVKGEVAEGTPEDQGWGSFLLESESPESSRVLKESECETHSRDTPAGRGENNLSEDKQNDVSGKAGKCSQEDQDWGSLLLESEETPKSTDTLKEFEYETESVNIDSPADGVIGMTNEVACDALSAEDKGCKSTDSPDMIRAESREDTKEKEAEDQSLLEMDYVLITGEENLSLRKDISVTRESNFTSQEVATAVEQTDCLETFSADSSDTLQSISIINESEGQSALETEWDSFYLAEKSSAVVPQKLGDEKKSPRSPIQDQEWTVVGQNGVDDISPEESHSRADTIESLSRHPTKELEDVLSQKLICETQAGTLLEKSPHKSLKQEEKNSHNSRTATLLSQVVSGDDESDVHSEQHSGRGVVAEQEIEKEIQFVDREIEFSHMSR